VPKRRAAVVAWRGGTTLRRELTSADAEKLLPLVRENDETRPSIKENHKDTQTPVEMMIL
jgi:hypothetical protein